MVRKCSYVVIFPFCCGVSLIFMGCGPTKFKFTPTPWPVTTLLTAPTPLPEKTPPSMHIWGGITVKTICFQTELNLVGPWVDGKTVAPNSIGEMISNILQNMGIQVLDQDNSCEAIINVVTDVSPMIGSYHLGGSCFTGGQVYSSISLSATGHEAYNTTIQREAPVAEQVSSDWCREHEEPEDWLDTDWFIDLWFEPILDFLVDVWGSQVMVWSLDQVCDKPRLLGEKISAIGPTDEIVLALIYASQEDNPCLHNNAVRLIGNFAPEAEEAIPFLTQLIREHYIFSSVRDEIEALEKFGPLAKIAVPVLIQVLGSEFGRDKRVVHRGLVTITGQDFGLEAQKWQEWWEANR